MRVITGTARGRRLGELTGKDTRPTTDRVKEGLFNVIQFDIEGRRVLDLFAGTGQLGIECLSRGAAHCTFVDQRKDAVKLVRENLEATGRILGSLRGILCVKLLPYHALARTKYASLGMPDTMPQADSPDDDALHQAAAVLERFGLRARSGRE